MVLLPARAHLCLPICPLPLQLEATFWRARPLQSAARQKPQLLLWRGLIGHRKIRSLTRKLAGQQKGKLPRQLPRGRREARGKELS